MSSEFPYILGQFSVLFNSIRYGAHAWRKFVKVRSIPTHLLPEPVDEDVGISPSSTLSPFSASKILFCTEKMDVFNTIKGLSHKMVFAFFIDIN